MPRVCKECGLEFDNKKLHDTHRKKCVKEVTFIAHNGQEITVTRNQNGTFLCYCSHGKCPKDQGFATIDSMQKHMKNLKTTWLGREKKVQSSFQPGSLTSDITLLCKQSAHEPAVPHVSVLEITTITTTTNIAQVGSMICRKIMPHSSCPFILGILHHVRPSHEISFARGIGGHCHEISTCKLRAGMWQNRSAYSSTNSGHHK